MNLSFPSNSTIEVTFKVGIAGTQMLPQNVSVVLERDGKSLSYPAIKEGDDWKAMVDKPGTFFGVGPVNVSVNILLNSRLFTPMKAKGDIVEETEQTKEEPTIPKEPMDEIIPDVAPTPTETKTESVATPIITPKVKLQPIQKKVDSVIKKAPIKDKIPTSILKSIKQDIRESVPVKIKEATPIDPPIIFSLKKIKIISK